MSPAGLDLLLAAGVRTHKQAACITGYARTCGGVDSRRLTNRIWLQAQTVILINCGAQADLWNILQLQPGSGTRIIVADSHRCAVLPKATHSLWCHTQVRLSCMTGRMQSPCCLCLCLGHTRVQSCAARAGSGMHLHAEALHRPLGWEVSVSAVPGTCIKPAAAHASGSPSAQGGVKMKGSNGHAGHCTIMLMRWRMSSTWWTRRSSPN